MLSVLMRAQERERDAGGKDFMGEGIERGKLQNDKQPNAGSNGMEAPEDI